MTNEMVTGQVETAHSLLVPDLLGYTWRPPRREDLPALHQMMLAADKADDKDWADSLEDMQTRFDDPWSNPATDARLAVIPDGQVAAMARIFINPQPEDECRAFMWSEVHPAHRGRGLEEYALNWMEARSRQRLQTLPAELPRLLRTSCLDSQPDNIARLEQLGFRPGRYFYRMRRDLHQPIPDKPLPEGLTLRTFSLELSRAMLDALNEAFRDHWSFELVTAADWEMFFLKRSSFRPELTFVVMDGEQVAGLSYNTVSPEDNARRGINEGVIAELAVRRPWRKRGVATALLCQSMRAFKAEGLDYAMLGVDTENLSGALRLYESIGFRPHQRIISFDKPVTRT
ncbi:MAG TPA: GNAT family N-acetyltransferase [Anaerolineae bacterium]|nr:GNAT family N-acetyltransferase [Anaerolineae bacterium]